MKCGFNHKRKNGDKNIGEENERNKLLKESTPADEEAKSGGSSERIHNNSSCF